MSAVNSAISQIKELKESLPEKADIDVLRHYGDIILLKGLMEMGEIIVSPAEEKVELEENSGVAIKIMDPSNKIKAFNAVVGLGRYVEQRAANEGDESELVEMAESSLILDEGDEDE